MPFEFESTAIDDVVIIRPEVFKDDRGFLLETYEQEAFDERGLSTDFILEFYSASTQGVLRGLHQQADPYQQAKVVRCFDGEIFDVAVDVRPDSNTFGSYVSRRLSGENKQAMYIPRGFLHGFVTLSSRALVHYKVDNEYAPKHERGVRWDDSDIGIQWPTESPVVSEKDQQWPRLQESIYGQH